MATTATTPQVWLGVIMKGTFYYNGYMLVVSDADALFQIRSEDSIMNILAETVLTESEETRIESLLSSGLPSPVKKVSRDTFIINSRIAGIPKKYLENI